MKTIKITSQTRTQYCIEVLRTQFLTNAKITILSIIGMFPAFIWSVQICRGGSLKDFIYDFCDNLNCIERIFIKS